jgi:hypothetical protein
VERKEIRVTERRRSKRRLAIVEKEEFRRVVGGARRDALLEAGSLRDPARRVVVDADRERIHGVEEQAVAVRANRGTAAIVAHQREADDVDGHAALCGQRRGKARFFASACIADRHAVPLGDLRGRSPVALLHVRRA